MFKKLHLWILLLHFSIQVSGYAQHQPVTQYKGVYFLNLKSDSSFIIKDLYSSWVSGNYRWAEDTIFFQPTTVYDTVVFIHTDSTKEINLILSADTIRSFAGIVRYKKLNSLSFDKKTGTFTASLKNEFIPHQEWEKIPYSAQYQYMTCPKFLIKKRNKLGIHVNGKFIEVVKKIPSN